MERNRDILREVINGEIKEGREQGETREREMSSVEKKVRKEKVQKEGKTHAHTKKKFLGLSRCTTQSFSKSLKW